VSQRCALPQHSTQDSKIRRVFSDPSFWSPSCPVCTYERCVRPIGRVKYVVVIYMVLLNKKIIKVDPTSRCTHTHTHTHTHTRTHKHTHTHTITLTTEIKVHQRSALRQHSSCKPRCT
jgi:ABC-type nickel/cobalt efflux system permease component RcnA